MTSSISIKELSVLIVDDNRYFVQRMAGMLDEMPNIWNIQAAHSYDEAVHQVNLHKHDVILLDINMPGKSGISFLKTLKQIGHQATVIMLTNFTEAFYRERCLLLGASYFLDKTADFENVPAILNGIM